MTRPVILVFLDGYDPGLEARYRAAGDLPAIQRLRDRSAVVPLEHGAPLRTGLAGEHLSTGLTPEAIGRFSAVDFDPATYVAVQSPARSTPFTERLDAKSVVFDMPYFNLKASPNTTGIVNWGAHDPGVASAASPDRLWDDLVDRVGEYPAKQFIYCNPQHDDARAAAMGPALARAVDVRSDAVSWLLTDAVTDWDLALVSVSEAHSAAEGLWYGVDPTHPQRDLPSAPSAAAGLHAVYVAIDHLVDRLVSEHHDAIVVLCTMHGMQANTADVAAMVLLPELLHRAFVGQSLLDVPDDWREQSGPVPIATGWSAALAACFPDERRRFRKRAKKPTGNTMPWMPASRYQPWWSQMPAFAVPAFYDGRVRVNLAGREAEGVVAASDYDRTLDEVEALVRACRDPQSGGPVVAEVSRCAAERGVDPTALGSSEVDMIITWSGARAFDHPEHGTIGPIPLRRAAGHGGLGELTIAGPGIAAGQYPQTSAFDVAPTIASLLGVDVVGPMSGQSIDVASERSR